LSTKSPSMLSTIQIANQVAYSSNAIHIEGNVGTGKQMLAEMIHNASPLSTMPFYVYSCSEKYPQIIDKELFGSPGDSDDIIYQKYLSTSLPSTGEITQSHCRKL